MYLLLQHLHINPFLHFYHTAPENNYMQDDTAVSTTNSLGAYEFTLEPYKSSPNVIFEATLGYQNCWKFKRLFKNYNTPYKETREKVSMVYFLPYY